MEGRDHDPLLVIGDATSVDVKFGCQRRRNENGHVGVLARDLGGDHDGGKGCHLARCLVGSNSFGGASRVLSTATRH